MIPYSHFTLATLVIKPFMLFTFKYYNSFLLYNSGDMNTNYTMIIYDNAYEWRRILYIIMLAMFRLIAPALTWLYEITHKQWTFNEYNSEYILRYI